MEASDDAVNESFEKLLVVGEDCPVHALRSDFFARLLDHLSVDLHRLKSPNAVRGLKLLLKICTERPDRLSDLSSEVRSVVCAAISSGGKLPTLGLTVLHSILQAQHCLQFTDVAKESLLTMLRELFTMPSQAGCHIRAIECLWILIRTANCSQSLSTTTVLEATNLLLNCIISESSENKVKYLAFMLEIVDSCRTLTGENIQEGWVTFLQLMVDNDDGLGRIYAVRILLSLTESTGFVLARSHIAVNVLFLLKSVLQHARGSLDPSSSTPTNTSLDTTNATKGQRKTVVLGEVLTLVQSLRPYSANAHRPAKSIVLTEPVVAVLTDFLTSDDTAIHVICFQFLDGSLKLTGEITRSLQLLVFLAAKGDVHVLQHLLDHRIIDRLLHTVVRLWWASPGEPLALTNEKRHELVLRCLTVLCHLLRWDSVRQILLPLKIEVPGHAVTSRRRAREDRAGSASASATGASDTLMLPVIDLLMNILERGGQAKPVRVQAVPVTRTPQQNHPAIVLCACFIFVRLLGDGERDILLKRDKYLITRSHVQSLVQALALTGVQQTAAAPSSSSLMSTSTAATADHPPTVMYKSSSMSFVAPQSQIPTLSYRLQTSSGTSTAGGGASNTATAAAGATGGIRARASHTAVAPASNSQSPSVRTSQRASSVSSMLSSTTSNSHAQAVAAPPAPAVATHNNITTPSTTGKLQSSLTHSPLPAKLLLFACLQLSYSYSHASFLLTTEIATVLRTHLEEFLQQLYASTATPSVYKDAELTVELLQRLWWRATEMSKSLEIEHLRQGFLSSVEALEPLLQDIDQALSSTSTTNVHVNWNSVANVQSIIRLLHESIVCRDQMLDESVLSRLGTIGENDDSHVSQAVKRLVFLSYLDCTQIAASTSGCGSGVAEHAAWDDIRTSAAGSPGSSTRPDLEDLHQQSRRVYQFCSALQERLSNSSVEVWDWDKYVLWRSTTPTTTISTAATAAAATSTTADMMYPADAMSNLWIRTVLMHFLTMQSQPGSQPQPEHVHVSFVCLVSKTYARSMQGQADVRQMMTIATEGHAAVTVDVHWVLMDSSFGVEGDLPSLTMSSSSRSRGSFPTTPSTPMLSAPPPALTPVSTTQQSSRTRSVDEEIWGTVWLRRQIWWSRTQLLDTLDRGGGVHPSGGVDVTMDSLTCDFSISSSNSSSSFKLLSGANWAELLHESSAPPAGGTSASSTARRSTTTGSAVRPTSGTVASGARGSASGGGSGSGAGGSTSLRGSRPSVSPGGLGASGGSVSHHAAHTCHLTTVLVHTLFSSALITAVADSVARQCLSFTLNAASSSSGGMDMQGTWTWTTPLESNTAQVSAEPSAVLLPPPPHQQADDSHLHHYSAAPPTPPPAPAAVNTSSSASNTPTAATTTASAATSANGNGSGSGGKNSTSHIPRLASFTANTSSSPTTAHSSKGVHPGSIPTAVVSPSSHIPALAHTTALTSPSASSAQSQHTAVTPSNTSVVTTSSEEVSTTNCSTAAQLCWELLHQPLCLRDEDGLQAYLLQEGVFAAQDLVYCDADMIQTLAAFLKTVPQRRFMHAASTWTQP